MIVTERNYKRISVEVSNNNEMENAEKYIKAQYGINKELFWICTTTFLPYSSEPTSCKWSASIDIDLSQ